MSSQYLNQTKNQENIDIKVNNLRAQNAYIQTIDISTFTVNDLSATNIDCEFLTAQSIGTDTLIATTSTFYSFDAAIGNITDISAFGVSATNISSDYLSVNTDLVVQDLTVQGTLVADIGTYASVGGGLTFEAEAGTGTFVQGGFVATKIPQSGGASLIHFGFSGAVTNVNIGGTPTIVSAVLPTGYTPANVDSLVGVAHISDSAGDVLGEVVMSSGKIQVKKTTGTWDNGSAYIAPFEVTYIAFV
jgi:hypothetical protein